MNRYGRIIGAVASERLSTLEILNKYSHDYKVVFVGDATMAPYEITHAGGSVEHWNEEPGAAGWSALVKSMTRSFGLIQRLRKPGNTRRR